MPIISVHLGRNRGVAARAGGTQVITGGPFTLSGAFTLELDPTVFTLSGEYVLFNYAAATSVSYAPKSSLQQALNDWATVDSSQTGFTVVSLTDYPAESKIKLVLS